MSKKINAEALEALDLQLKMCITEKLLQIKSVPKSFQLKQ
jgi:hypothetical protein